MRCFSLCLQSNSGGAARLRASFKINRKANGIGEMIQHWRRSRPRSTNLEYPTRFVLLNYFGWTNQTQFHRKSISFHIFLTLCLLHHHWTRKSNFNKIVRASKCTRKNQDWFLVKIKSLRESKNDKFGWRCIIVTSVVIATLETFRNNRPSIIIVSNIDSFLPWTKNRLKRERKNRIQSPIQLFESRTARGILHLFLLLLLLPRIDLPGKQKTTLSLLPFTISRRRNRNSNHQRHHHPPSPRRKLKEREKDHPRHVEAISRRRARACFSMLEERNRHCGYGYTDFYPPLLPNVCFLLRSLHALYSLIPSDRTEDIFIRKIFFHAHDIYFSLSYP